jgi:hypothetical protein
MGRRGRKVKREGDREAGRGRRKGKGGIKREEKIEGGRGREIEEYFLFIYSRMFMMLDSLVVFLLRLPPPPPLSLSLFIFSVLPVFFKESNKIRT